VQCSLMLAQLSKKYRIVKSSRAVKLLYHILYIPGIVNNCLDEY
jgi:hypothetical protein